MRVIVTRPADVAAELAAKLRAFGHQPILLPLLDIVDRAINKFPRKNYQLVAITSANCVRPIRDHAELKNVPVVAVGQQSRQAAIAAGFNACTAAGGDVTGLSKYIRENFAPAYGPVLYPSGAETSGDLEGQLKAAGFDVDRIVTYDAVPLRLVGQEAEIKSAEAVLLYSPRTAKIWLTEIRRLQLEDAVSKLRHYCLSTAVAASLPQSWSKIIAQLPTESALLQALANPDKA